MRAAKNWLSLSAISILSLPLFASHSDIDRHWGMTTEYVYLKRAKVTNRKLAKDSSNLYCDNGCWSTIAISSKDLVNKLGFESGARLSGYYYPDTKSIYEASCTYVLPWTASKTVYGNGTISYPFHNYQVTQDYNFADQATAHYKSHFYTIEMNYWRNSAVRGRDYFVFSGIFGIRYFHLNEKSTLAFTTNPDSTCISSTIVSHYNTKAHNDVIGIQGGFDFQTNPYMGFQFDLKGLGGLGLNRAYGRVKLLDENDTIYIRDYQKQDAQSVVFADVEARVGYRVSSGVNIHAGYQMFYASGLAFSVAQYSTSSDPSNERFYHNGPMILHGILVGCDFRF
jgi:hypothetical protein